jgi:hypothetical protein
MDYLYERKIQLETEIKKLERNAFNSQVRPILAELRARHNEVVKAINALEHET